MNGYRRITYDEVMKNLTDAQNGVEPNLTLLADYIEQERRISRIQKPPVEFYTTNFQQALEMVSLLVNADYEALFYKEENAFVVKGNHTADWADRFRLPDLED